MVALNDSFEKFIRDFLAGQQYLEHGNIAFG
jgi:hypothetical protein